MATKNPHTFGDLEPTEATTVSACSDFVKQLNGYGLTTAHIFYRRPDHPWLLQSYIWQDYDLCPKFPQLQRFLDFWKQSLEGPLHSVMVAHARLIRPAELRTINTEFRLN
ncbi:usg protein [Xanthobacteraceae bacterium Astr-EGSB]|uniref:usg protein n=1 Tax=Astrobacterium formosum TaxID=3069710 RepID=UPI0027B7E1F7|nr:usg protein [Xanthobacteraceae bacterium Astr-EGSB]